MSLNIADLHSLLYGYDMFESVTPLSLHPLDRVTIHRIRIVPLEIGAAIGAGDVAGKYFHIEFFPAINRAEIWSAQAWRESLTRHLKLKDKQRAADPLYSLQSRLTIIESRIVFHLFSTVAITRTRAEAVAQAITRSGNPYYLSTLELFGPPADLLDDIATIRGEFQKLAPTIPANHPLANSLLQPTPEQLIISNDPLRIDDGGADGPKKITDNAGEEYPSPRD